VTEQFGIRITADTSQFKRGMAEVERTTQTAVRQFDLAGTAARALGAALAGISIAKLGRDFIEVSRNSQALEARLTFLTDSARGAAEAMSYIGDVAKRQSVDIYAVGDAYARMQAFVNSGKLSMGEMRTMLEGMNDLSKVHGLNTAQLGNVYYGLSQTLSQASIQMQELNQVVEPVPGLLDNIAKQAGVTSGEFRKLVAEAKVTSTDFKRYLIGALKDTEGASEDMSGTLDASFTRASNAYKRFLDAIGDTGLVDWLADRISIAAENTEALADALDRIFKPKNGAEVLDDIKKINAEIAEWEEVVSRLMAKNSLREGAFDQFLGAGENNAIKSALEQIKELQKERDKLTASLGEFEYGPFLPEKTKKEQDALTELSEEMKKAIKDAEKFGKALEKMRADAAFATTQLGRSNLGKALAEVDKLVADNIESYKLLGKEGPEAVKRLKDAVTELVAAETQQKIAEDIREAYQRSMEEAAEVAERERERLERPFIQAAENIQDAFADAFADIFENGIESFAGLGSAIKRIMAQAAAQSFTAGLMNGMSGGGSAAGSVGGGLFSSIGSSIGTSVLGNSGIFAGFNSAAASAMPSVFGMGAPIAGGIGPSAPGALTALGVNPATAALGIALIAAPMIIDGLKSRPHPASTFGGNFGEGGFSNVGLQAKHMGTEFGQGMAEQVAGIFAQLQGMGLTGIAGASIHGGVDDGRGFIRVGSAENPNAIVNFDPNNAKEMQAAILELGLALADTASVTNQDLKAALENVQVKGKDAAQVLQELAYAAALPELRRVFNESVALDYVTELDAGLGAIAKQYREYQARLAEAQKIGASTALVEALHAEKMKKITEQLNAKAVDTAAATREQLDNLRDTAREAKSLASSFQRAADSIGKMLGDMLIGNLSPLTPQARYNEAQRQFMGTASRARLGDADAANDLPEAARKFLEVSRDFNAGSGAYTSDFEAVQAQLEAAKTTALRQVDIQTRIATTAERQLAELQAIKEAVSGQGGGQGAQLAKFLESENGNIDRAIARLAGYTGQFGQGGLNRATAADPALAGRITTLRAAHGLPLYAAGGMLRSHQLSVVGERGPELVQSGTGGRVYSDVETRQMMSGGGWDTSRKLDSLTRAVSGLVKAQEATNAQLRNLAASKVTDGYGRRVA